MKANPLVLNNRQKMIIVFILISLGILIWQIRALMESNHPTVSSNQNREVQKPLQANFKNAGEKAQLQQSPLQSTSNNSQMDAVQQKYLSLVNEYQVVEMERLIAQDEAAIAQSRASQAESLAKMNQVMGSSNSSELSFDAARSHTSVGDPSGDYELIYTGEDNHQWTATLKKQGQFNDVTAGSVLPDGSKVLSVDDNGVLVSDAKGVRKLITFNGIEPLPSADAKDDAVDAPALVEKTPQIPPIPHTLLEKPQPKAAVELPKPLPIKAVPLQHPPVVVEKKIPPKPIQSSLVKPLDITKADKNTYTVQLIRGGNYQDILDLIKENHLKNNSQIIKINQIYVGVYGIYTQAKDAQDALNQLPKELQEEGAFVKKIGEIQSQMEKKSQ